MIKSILNFLFEVFIANFEQKKQFFDPDFKPKDSYFYKQGDA